LKNEFLLILLFINFWTAKRYYEILIEENVTEIIKKIYETSRTNDNKSIKSLCGLILDVINKEIQNIWILLTPTVSVVSALVAFDEIYI